MRVMVAGVGNIFLQDDGFGVEVVRRLSGVPLPHGTRVADYGVRGVHLAYELMDDYDGLILVTALRRADLPGTIRVLEPGLPDPADEPDTGTPSAADGQGMTPEALFALLHRLGVRLPWVLIVSCEPAELGDGMELSPAVSGAVNEAVRLVRQLLDERVGEPGR